MHRFQNPESSKPPSSSYLKNILNLVGLVVVLVVALAGNYATIPPLLRTILWILAILAAVSSLSLAAAPLWQMASRKLRVLALRKAQRRLLLDFSEILGESGSIFSSDGPYSLRYYFMSLCNEFVQDAKLHPALKSLHDRLLILTGWHDSLTALAGWRRLNESEYAKAVLDTVAFYRSASDVVREHNLLILPMTPTLKGRTNEHRIVKEWYNSHIAQLEQVLDKSRQINPELPFGGFIRF